MRNTKHFLNIRFICRRCNSHRCVVEENEDEMIVRYACATCHNADFRQMLFVADVAPGYAANPIGEHYG